jgi:4-diphosphocytidyl-2-C-methyl-D-erythritol kinase
MATSVRSFAKINIGLKIGPCREDGFHELRTIYQTVTLADALRVDVGRGMGIEIVCKDRRVPTDESNTCWRVAERVLKALKTRGKVRITIEKKLPVQGGLGAASSNAVAAMIALEKELKKPLPAEERLRIATEVGSDVPLFLIGGTVLGTGRGEQVFPMEDLPGWHCVIATPEVGVSTPQAFADWDRQNPSSSAPESQNRAFWEPRTEGDGAAQGSRDAQQPDGRKLTARDGSVKMEVFSRSVYEWLSGSFSPTGVPAGWDRAEALLLDLVRTGIENDFERVVFPKYPAIREAKRALERTGAKYVSLSGSGSAVYGLFLDGEIASKAAAKLSDNGVPALATEMLTRQQYWKEMMRPAHPAPSCQPTLPQRTRNG